MRVNRERLDRNLSNKLKLYNALMSQNATLVGISRLKNYDLNFRSQCLNLEIIDWL